MGSLQKLRAQGLAIKYELRRLGHWADYERAVAALDKTFDLYRLGKTYPNLMQRLLAFEEVALRARFLDDFPITETAKLRAFEGDVGLVDAWRKMFDAGDYIPDALRRNTGALEALSKAKGSRPNPNTYLDGDYITNHLAKFDDGASRLVKKSDYDNFGIGKPDAGKTEFVATKSEIDEILSLPVEQQAEKLGIPVDQIQNGGLVRVDFNPSNKIEMPSGNEWGANDQWIPGGKTSGGVDEAIVKTKGMQLDVDYTVIEL